MPTADPRLISPAASANDPELQQLLSRISSQLSDQERRHSDVLQDLRARLLALTDRAAAPVAEAAVSAAVQPESASAAGTVVVQLPRQSPLAVHRQGVLASGQLEKVYSSVASSYSDQMRRILDSKSQKAKVGEAPAPAAAQVEAAAVAVAQPAASATVSDDSEDDGWNQASADALTDSYETAENEVDVVDLGSSRYDRGSAFVDFGNSIGRSTGTVDRDWLEGRLGEMTRLVENAIHQPDAADHFHDLAGRLGEIEMRLDRAIESGHASDSEAETLRQLVGQVRALEDKLASMDFGSLDADILRTIQSDIELLRINFEHIAGGILRVEALEDSVARLIDEITQSHASLPSLADEAAGRAVASVPELIDRALASRGGYGDASIGGAEMASSAMSQPASHDPALMDRIETIQQVLLTLAAETREADSQAAQLLDVMRSLLIELNERVEAIEAGAPGRTVADPVVDDRVAALADDLLQPDDLPPVVEAESPAAARSDFQAFTNDETAAAAYPSEPEPVAGNVNNRIRQLRSKVRSGEPAAVEPQPVKAGGPTNGNREEMIAAARRAAKANADKAAGAGPTLKIGSKEAEAAIPAGGRRNIAVLSRGSKSGPRPVLVVAVVVLATAGAVMLYGKLTAKKRGPSVTIEQPAKPAAGGQKPAAEKKPAAAAPADPAGAAKDAGSERQSSLETPVDLLAGEADSVTLDNAATIIDNGDVVDDGAASPAADQSAAVLPASLATEDAVAGSSDGQPAAARKLVMPPKGLVSDEVRAAAAAGDPLAQYAVANRFAQSKGDVEAMANAASWYQRSASSGYAPAQYRLAASYERGRGVDADLGRAKAWYARAAEQGNLKAMHNLAVLHTNQANGRPNYEKAAEWFKLAAERGLADSQFNLAILFENGLGVDRNSTEAYMWFSLAANAGDREAATRRDTTRKHLAPTAAAKVDKLVKNWKPLAVEAAANDATPAIAAVAETPSVSVRQTADVDTADILADAIPVATVVPAAIGEGEVLEVQTLLSKLGYSASKPNGKLTKATTQAIRSFEERSGLTPTGEISNELLTRLRELAG